MLLNALHCPGQPLTESHPGPNVSRAKAEKASRGLRRSQRMPVDHFSHVELRKGVSGVTKES